MKMVSASKLRRAQDAILRMRPYASKMKEIFDKLNRSVSLIDNPFAEQKELTKLLIVAISSNGSLCGAFNLNIAKKVTDILQHQYAELHANDQVELLIIGKKAGDLLKKKYKIKDDKSNLLETISFEAIALLADKLMNEFIEGKYQKIAFVYNQFKNPAVQVLTTEQFLPLQIMEPEEETIETDYIFEPGQLEILNELIPKLLRIQLYKAILDSSAAEHGARMTAMHKATDNASDLIKELNLEYNKARQASITNQILEVVSGAEALNS